MVLNSIKSVKTFFFCCHLVLWNKVEACWVDTVSASTRSGGTIVKLVTQVNCIGRAADLSSGHAMANISCLFYWCIVKRLCEGWPSSAWVKFVLGGEENFSGGDRLINALCLVIIVGILEGRLCAMLERNLELSWGEDVSILIFTLH